MKLTTSLVASMLASAAVARPRPLEDGDPVEHKSRVTAFVIDENGNPSVECWEFTTLAALQQMSTRRADGSKATGYVTPIVSSRDSLEGIDILTWPEPSPIWPPPTDSVRSEWFDLTSHFSLFAVQGGLIRLNVDFAIGSNADDGFGGDHTFSLENGDDWFYFEDSYTYSDLAHSKSSAEPPVTIGTVSGGTTELLRLKYNDRPKYRVVHKGGCSFTGISVPESSGYNAKTSPAHSPLTVQVTQFGMSRPDP